MTFNNLQRQVGKVKKGRQLTKIKDRAALGRYKYQGVPIIVTFIHAIPASNTKTNAYMTYETAPDTVYIYSEII